MPDRVCKILLVEDNPAEVRLFKEAFYDSSLPHCIYIADNGQEALDVLYHQHNHQFKPRPDLIIMDINLPMRTGHEVLDRIKQDPVLRSIPVLMLTNSGSRQDVEKAYGRYANAYLEKPTELDDFITLVQTIEQFWFHTAELPIT